MATDDIKQFEKAFNDLSLKLERINKLIESNNEHFNFGGNVKKVWHNAFFYWISLKVPFDKLAEMDDVQLLDYMIEFAGVQQEKYGSDLPGKPTKEQILARHHTLNKGPMTNSQVHDLATRYGFSKKAMENKYREIIDQLQQDLNQQK